MNVNDVSCLWKVILSISTYEAGILCTGLTAFGSDVLDVFLGAIGEVAWVGVVGHDV